MLGSGHLEVMRRQKGNRGVAVRSHAESKSEGGKEGLLYRIDLRSFGFLTYLSPLWPHYGPISSWPLS